MKTLLVLLCVSTALAGLEFPGYWKAKTENMGFENWKTSKPRTPDYVQDSYEEDEDVNLEDVDIPRARWCVSSECEMRKCKRMVMEFNYQTVPKMRWSCVMASSIVECMKYVEVGRADLMSVPGEKIYKAGKLHNLDPILMEKFDTKIVQDYPSRFSSFEKNGFIQHYSVALVKKNSPIRTFTDLRNKKSCHYDIATHASFKNPICSLIYKKVVPVKGNIYESAADFFKKSCVPGAKTEGMSWNINGTMPDSMCSLCKGTRENFCEMKKGEPLYGYKGTLKCLADNEGHVGFFHTYDVMKDYDNLYRNYALVCGDKQRKLKWEHIMKKECHLNVEYPNVIVVHRTKTDEWKTKCTQVLRKAVQQFDPLNSKRKLDFNLFKSDPYCHTTDQDILYRTRNLIFNDHTRTFLPVTKGITFQTFLDNDITKMLDHCESLRPKPRAFICVVGNVEKAKCLKMKEYFSQKPITNTISWGCVEAETRYECMQLVNQGEADIVSLNATEMFIAGREFNLSPFLGENIINKKPLTESITVGVIRKDNDKSTEKLQDFKMCIRSDQTLSSYYHPIGWMMSNGTIPHPRHRTLTRFFTQGCWPGIEKFDFTKDYIGNHLIDWTEFLTDHRVDWKTWCQTPDWRNWEQKVEYNRWHQIHDYESDRFNYVKMKMYMEKPWIHRMHTVKWHEMINKVKTTFNWDRYDFHDFYDFFPKFKFFLKVYEKPESMCDKEWSAFLTWVGPQWDTEVDCTEHNKWTVRDWTLFKNWMNYEYADFIREMPTEVDKLHKDTFIRFYIYSNRFDWLIKQWKKLQWTHPTYKTFRQQFCKTCTGPIGKECSIDPQYEMRSNHKDILHCVYNKGGELGFMDAYTLESKIIEHGYQRRDFVLLCPDGTKVDYIGPQSFDKCNFGRVPTRSLVTCNSHDGVWRWAVTKAFLEAQKIFKGNFLNEWNFNMFEGDVIFSKDVIGLIPIKLTEQTYQHRLGPMFLRSMEGLFYHIPLKNVGEIEEVIEHETGIDEGIHKDFIDTRVDLDDSDVVENMHHKKYDKIVRGVKHITGKDGLYMKHPMSYKMFPYIHHKYMGPVGHKIKGRMGHKLRGRMGHKFMGIMKDKLINRNHRMFPDVKDPIGEIYSTVITTRNGTCNGISREITCFGERKIVQRLVGRITKTYVSIPLCPKPAVFVKRYIEFTCNTGVGYMAPVMTATKCSYLPCKRGYWVPDWSLDDHWKGKNLYKGEKHWGTETWWNPVHHVTNKNWFLKQEKVLVQRSHKLSWLGQKWRNE